MLADFEYPLTPEQVADECGDVTIELAEGSVTFGAIMAESNSARFASPGELSDEILGLLPRHAVGEPYQSEGDA